MARIRTIKPEFPQSESVGRVSRESRLCFILLWTLADDSGRLRGNSRMLASLLYPYDDDAKSHIDTWLSELSREKCILRYQVDGESYIEICNWLKHQKIDKPSASKIPPSTSEFANPREDSEKNAADQGRDQGVDQGKDHSLSGKPDASSLEKQKKTEAREVLQFLNEKAGRRYQDNRVNLGFILARLKDGATVTECRQVIAKKCREWSTDPKMCEYLRPATLFNATKFSQYQGELIANQEGT